jgi:hypothetical protein
MEALGDRRLADLRREVAPLQAATSTTDLALDLTQIVATSSGDGRKKDAVMIIGAGKKISAAMKSDALPIKKDFVKRNVGVWRYAVVWKRSVIVRRLIARSVSLVIELLLRRIVWWKKLASETVGRIGLRCGLEPPPTLPPAANHPAQENQQQQRVTARSISLSSVPDPVGSSVPLLVMAPAATNARQQRPTPAPVCSRCGSNHLIEVCQEKEPWEYVAPYYGSEEFGSGFYFIPATELESPPLDQMNYAHITVEKGEVTSRDIEHEFDVWADSMKINWRFFAKVVSPTEFRTRFPSAKAIEELSHFGKLFMRTVPEAIINIEKWSGDIEPISVMQEAWFRIKGIPMKFRNKSTLYYAASFVGKPLGLDKNCLRNFAYVQIGCQDLSLVPNTKIGE